ncbi:hypothetical protein [Neorickettsia sp. 179522]|uniref:hypothetical protein n=1 Tax=Neorickettsia sp. 179522 TaxID=1714371 RepID=UPI000792CFC4|nr:hypothetical protein [Neorickettsia sp. 179522]KYH12278.1 hypothetical protein AS219_00390 [Neorickettsia sp. 179522]
MDLRVKIGVIVGGLVFLIAVLSTLIVSTKRSKRKYPSEEILPSQLKPTVRKEGEWYSEEHVDSYGQLNAPNSVFSESVFSQDIQVPGLKGCFLSSDGILGAEGEEIQPNWRGNVIIVDPSASVIQDYCYSRTGDSRRLYEVLGICNGPIEECMKKALQFLYKSSYVNPRVFSGQNWKARVLHIAPPDVRPLNHSIAENLGVPCTLFSCTFVDILYCIKARLRNFAIEATLLIPVMDLPERGKHLLKSDRLKVFAEAFLDIASKGLYKPLSEALGVKNVKICCGNRDIQLALAEVMAQQGGAGRDSVFD